MESVSLAAARRRPWGTRRVPAALGALLVATTLLGLMWALLVPPWQSPDEPQHFAYVQSLAGRLALPGDPHRHPFSAAQAAADNAVGASREAFYPDAVPPSWSPAVDAGFQTGLRHHPSTSDGGGPNSAAVNPPLYYLFADVAYWVSGGGADAFTQLYAIRIWGVLLLLVTGLGAWLLAGEVLGPRPEAQLACAAVAVLVPSETFISTSVNPDALMVALWALALWLGARVITRAGPRRESVALGLITAAAILTKATSYALVPATLLALVIGWRRQPPAERRSALVQLGPPLAALAAPVLAWLALAISLGRSAVNTIHGTRPATFNVRQFLSYVWQFYLPKLPFQTTLRETPGLPIYDLWVREGWGVFGWRDVGLPSWTYEALAIVSGVTAIAAAAILARIRGSLRLSLLAFFGLTVIALLVGLHVTDYRALTAGQPAVIQGRYLLPVLPVFALTVGLVVSRLPRRWAGPAAAAVLAGLLLLQVLALATIAREYYT